MSYFNNIEDPRIDRTKQHLLKDIIFITIAAVICNAETWADIERYARLKEDWLRKHLQLPNGIPSHDTFNRVFSMLDSEQLETCFREWVKDATESFPCEIISIDGKSLRGSKQAGSKSLVHLVSAWATENQLSLGQVKVEDKSNEITAIPKLLSLLELEGNIVSIDAMGCQKEIAAQIVEKKANYILALKGNQKELHENVKESVSLLTPDDQWEDIDFGHGRIETRQCRIYKDLSLVRREWDWANLKTLVEIRSHRHHKVDGREEEEVRYYISSLDSDAKTIAQGIRKHWSIENNLHWSLDVSFNEDSSRKRAGNAAQNFAMMNRIALSILKSDKQKRSIRGKRLDAGWDNDYLFQMLSQ